MTTHHREALDVFADQVQTVLGEELDQIVLFGSVARNEESPDSDVDVLVVVDEASIDVKDTVISIAYDVMLEYDVYISPKILSADEHRELTDAGSPFLSNVQADGEIVYG